jgi:hypothetical protein
MGTEYLDQLAHQLKVDKTPACRRAINRILEDLKKRCENGEYRDPKEAESALSTLFLNSKWTGTAGTRSRRSPLCDGKSARRMPKSVSGLNTVNT